MPGNTLSLLFKIDADSSEAQQNLKNLQDLEVKMGAAASESFQQASNAWNQFVQVVKDGAKEFLGFRDASKAASEEAKKHQDNLNALGLTTKQTITAFNQLKNGLEDIGRGNFGESFGNIGRSMFALGPEVAVVIAALAAFAAAAYGATKAVEGVVDTADKIGTKSKDDFDKLKASLREVGVNINNADRALAQNLLKSIEHVQSAVTGLFTIVLRTDGKAIIAFLETVTKYVTALAPLAQKVADIIKDTIVGLLAEAKLFEAIKSQPSLLLHPEELGRKMADFVRQVRAEIDAIKPPAAVFDPTGNADKAREKQLETMQKGVEERLALIKAEGQEAKLVYEAQTKQLQQQYATREIDLKQATAAQTKLNDEYLAGLDERTNKEYDLNLVLASIQAAREKQHLDEIKFTTIEKETNVERIESYKQYANAATTANKEIIKTDLERMDALEELKRREQEIGDAVIRQRQAQAVPGGGGAGAIPGVIDLQDAINQLPKPGGFLADLESALKSSGLTFEGWGKTAINIMTSVGKAAQQTLAAFILTGKGGGLAFKQLAADIISSLAIQAAVKAIFEVAEGFAALARYDPWSASNHFHAAAIYAIVSAASLAVGLGIGAAGGLAPGGASAAGTAAATGPPNTTINVGGAGGQLGTTPGQAFGTINDTMGRLADKLSSMSPGDVVTVASNTTPSAFANGITRATQRDATFTRTLGLTLLPST